MEREQEERRLSTADLADPNSADAEGRREQELSPDDTSEPPSRLESREATDGRYDQLPDEADREPEVSRETVSAASQGGDEVTPSTVEGAGVSATTDAPSPLFEKGDVRHFESEWEAIQTGFVDEPRRAVERADTLVAELMQRLAESFAHERSQLEAQWDRGDDVSTEDLRLALQRYRSFFGRLLQA